MYEGENYDAQVVFVGFFHCFLCVACEGGKGEGVEAHFFDPVYGGAVGGADVAELLVQYRKHSFVVNLFCDLLEYIRVTEIVLGVRFYGAAVIADLLDDVQRKVKKSLCIFLGNISAGNNVFLSLFWQRRIEINVNETAFLSGCLQVFLVEHRMTLIS